MSDRLHLFIEGRPAGMVERLSGGRLRLRYAPGHAGTPLSVTMPLALETHPDRVLRPWLQGLLPDNEAVLARWARTFRVPASPFSLLGTPIGEDCAGAVQLVRPERLDDVAARRGGVRWLDESELAERLRLLRADRTAWLGPRATSGQFSLAGAQAKTALLFDGRRFGEAEGAHPTSHILKPALAQFEHHEINEHLCLAAARRAGLLAARSFLLVVEDQTAVVVERYDRRRTAEGLVRVHQEDLCQALSVPPDRKYQSERGPGPGDVVALLRRVIAAPEAERAVWRFLDALIFNWFIAGTDAHAKNYGLLLSGPQVRLAPLYDLASALPYRGLHEREMKLAMKLGRDYEVWPHHDPWPGAARAFGVPADQLGGRVRELGAMLPDAFRDAAAEPEVTALASPLAGELVSRVADRVARCLRVLGPSPA